jgi:oligopeptide transport system permease protein
MTDETGTTTPDLAPAEERPEDETLRLAAEDPSTSGASTIAAAESGGRTTIRRASLWGDAWLELRRNALFIVSGLLIVVFLIMATAPGLFTGTNPRACDLANSLGRPSADHWFGFDLQGCDYYAQVVYGARASIVIGVVATAVAAFIAVVLGALAGYYGGVLDAVIARISDIWFAIPLILGGIVVLGVLQNQGIPQVALVLILLGWPTMLRLMRSSVLSVRETDYVQAARALGASDLRILRLHILPNAIAPVIVYATIYVGILISAEAALSFLGVGLQLPAISWGLMLSQAQNRVLQAPHLLFFPGLFLSLTIFSFILMGDALRDALDPKLR